jgi:LmbE family N-acetylglucosaminyl deacetylase
VSTIALFRPGLASLFEEKRGAETPRVLIIAAHPDDETIGAGALICRANHVHIVHVTEGSPLNPSDAIAAGFSTREAYANARRDETIRALALAHLAPHSIQSLPFIDQQLCFHLEELTVCLRDLIEKDQPSILLTHAYEGGHPDHDSTALACYFAQSLLLEDHPDLAPELYEFTGYHAASQGIQAYEFLPSRGSAPYCYNLLPEEREMKIHMLRAFRTQARTLEPFLSPVCEMFRKAPPYDFRDPPHEGKLFYENFEWGVDGAGWRKLAHQAAVHLQHRKKRAS